MNRSHLHSDIASDADIEAAFEWYESEQPGLGFEFLDEVRAVYDRILDTARDPAEWQSRI